MLIFFFCNLFKKQQRQEKRMFGFKGMSMHLENNLFYWFSWFFKGSCHSNSSFFSFFFVCVAVDI